MTGNSYVWERWDMLHKILVRKLEWKRPFGRPRLRWKDIVKMNLKELGCEGADCIQLPQDGIQWRNVMQSILWTSERLSASEEFCAPHLFLIPMPVVLCKDFMISSDLSDERTSHLNFRYTCSVEELLASLAWQ
jgi:hypothetical protein